MSANPDRRAELIAAAVAGELSDADDAELRAMADADPTVDIEIDEFTRMVDTIAQTPPSLPWLEPQSSPGLRRRVVAAAGSDRTVPRSRRHIALLTTAAAVVGIAVGAGTVIGLDAFSSRPVTGPPGTLGAFEEIEFTGTSSGIDVDGGLVAHTWGTETVLEMTGVPEYGTYSVYVIEQSGVESASGSFLGSTVTIDCRMNAAVMRTDVAGIEIRNSDGSVLAAARVPDAL